MRGKGIKAVLFSMIFMFMVVPVAMGGVLDITRVTNYYEDNYSFGGGEFTITPLSGFPVEDVLDLYAGVAKVSVNGAVGFESFCMETNEYITIPGTYDAVLNTGAVAGGASGQTVPGYDPLSQGAAYLYYSFATGTLSLYDYTPGEGREDAAEDLQNALWYLEGEGGSLTAAYTTLLVNTFGSVANAILDNNGLYAVGVLNLTSTDGKHQDQLVLTPEPGSLLLLGIGVLSAVALRRKLKKS